jgi:hypothetical protein
MSGSDEVLAQARRLAADLDELFRAGPAIADAELSARGLRPVTIAHGAPDTGTDEQLIHQVLPRMASQAGPVAAVRGGSEHTTWLFTGPAADRSAAAFIGGALSVAPLWWRITATAHPVWPA